MCLETKEHHSFCHICNIKQDLHNEAEDLDQSIPELDEQRSDRSQDLDRFTKDQSPEGKLINSTFRETAC